MPRVVPSQVVEVIDSLFPNAKREVEGQPMRLNWDDGTRLLAIVELASQIPEELLVLDSSHYAEYVASLAAIRWYIQRWQTTEKISPSYSRELSAIRGLRQFSPVALVRQALALCPDEFPLSGTTELAFITDAALRESLRLDTSATNKALTSGDWKAATVLAGSVVEALILWALQQQQPGNIQTAVKNLLGSKKLSKNPDNNLGNWVLFEYIEVAAELKVISDETATQARLAKDFRNLIHPGRAQRLGQECNRATALSAVAALEHVVNDLSP